MEIGDDMNDSYIDKKLNVLFDNDKEAIIKIMDWTRDYINKNKNKFNLEKNANKFYKERITGFAGIQLEMFLEIFITKYIYINKLELNENSINLFRKTELGQTIQGELTC